MARARVKRRDASPTGPQPAPQEAPAENSKDEPQKESKIVLTGMAGRLGRLVAKRLHGEGKYRVVGLDRRSFEGLPKDMEYHQVDLRSKKARDVFRGGDVQALIHMGVMHDPRQTAEERHTWNVVGGGKLFEYCQTYRVPKVIVLSSANVYGPRPENPQFLGEEAPLMAAQDFPEIRDLIELDMLASSFFWRAREIETVILRPVHILGRVHNAASNYLRLAYPPALLGFDPMMQVVHEEDVARAILLALQPGIRGIFNVTGPGEVPLSVLLRELRKPVVRLPHVLAYPALRWLWRAKLTSFPVPELAHIQYVCMVDGSRAQRELGYQPRMSLHETIRAVEQFTHI